MMDAPKSFQHWLMRCVSAWSQLLNVLFLCGHSNESISGRSYREGWWTEKWIDRLFFWQDRHCRRAYFNDLKWAKEYIEMHDGTHERL
jgi:hypothetical protein